MLEWSPPSDTGGRKDLTYSVICKKCGSDASQCEICGGGIRFIPRHTGLINSSVTVLDFVSHVNYTFEIEATNGVSELSFSPKQFTAITVTTDQDGKSHHRASVTVPLSFVHFLWVSFCFLEVWVSELGCFADCYAFLCVRTFSFCWWGHWILLSVVPWPQNTGHKTTSLLNVSSCLNEVHTLTQPEPTSGLS